MKLDLDSLFTLFEELEKNWLLTEEEVLTSEQLVLKLLIPRIEITQKTLGNNKILRDFISKISGQNIAEKLNSLDFAIKKESQKVPSEDDKMQNIIERIAILDALSRMFNEFDASPAGFLNEDFISAFFPDGKALNAQESNDKNLITDVVVGDINRGEHYSLKTLTKGSKIGGSAFNLCNTIAIAGSVTYLVFYKSFEGAGENKKVSSYSMAQKQITRENLGSSGIKLGGSMNIEQYYEKYKHLFGTKKEENPLQEDVTQQVPLDAISSIKNVKKDIKQDTDEKMKVEFVIPETEFSTPVATVVFSTEEALKRISILVGETIQKIKELHDTMQELTSGLAKYFTTQDLAEKEKLGVQMIETSKYLEPKTEEIVQK